METFSDFKIDFQFDHSQMGWRYAIYKADGKTFLGTDGECYELQGIARYAAIGHIHLMEINSQCEHS